MAAQTTPSINVYDSLPTVSLGYESLKEQVAAIICIKNKFFEICFINVQQQCDSCDCTLFAIANSTALAKIPIEYVTSRIEQMWQHLEEYFEAGAMHL